MTIKQSGRMAITTRYRGPTNNRGARIVAEADTGLGRRRLVYDFSHGDPVEDRHARAAEALCKELCWSGDMISGATEHGYVFVFTDADGG